MLQCNACLETYQPKQPDGTPFRHRCPPLSRVELATAIGAGTLPYAPGTAPAMFTSSPTPAGSTTAGPLLAAADAWLVRQSFDRANLRDEFPVSVDAAGNVLAIVAAGAGVTVLPDPVPTAA